MNKDMILKAVAAAAVAVAGAFPHNTVVAVVAGLVSYLAGKFEAAPKRKQDSSKTAKPDARGQVSDEEDPRP